MTMQNGPTSVVAKGEPLPELPNELEAPHLSPAAELREPASGRGARRSYEPPAVLESGSFERLVLACAHLPTGQGNCHPDTVRS